MPGDCPPPPPSGGYGKTHQEAWKLRGEKGIRDRCVVTRALNGGMETVPHCALSKSGFFFSIVGDFYCAQLATNPPSQDWPSRCLYSRRHEEAEEVQLAL